MSSTGSDRFSNCDFDVEFRVGGRDGDTNNDDREIVDKGVFRNPVEEITLQDSSPRTSPERSKSDTDHLPEMDLLSLFNDSKWQHVKKQLRRLQKHENPQEICRVLTRRDSNDESILHIAAWKAPPGLFQFMVRLIPERKRADCLSLEDKDGNTPFHLLCANLTVDCVDFSVVEDTLMLDIGVLDKPNSYGDTSLHLLIASDALSMTQPVECDEETAIEHLAGSILSKLGTERLSLCKNAKGLTLLHIAIANQARAGVLSHLLRLIPGSSKDADERGMLPLHFIAGSPLVPASFVQELIKVHPESITSRDTNGDTPLHLQIVNASGRQNTKIDQNVIQVTELLLAEKPGELVSGDDNPPSPMMIQNNDGLTPLHVCAIFGAPSELTGILVMSTFTDESALFKSETGATALHLVCESEKVREIVHVVRRLSSTKEACSSTDNEGRTPLVAAVQNPKVSAEVIKILCRAYPEGLTIAVNGMIALHHALNKGPDSDAAVVKALLKAAPETINVTWKGNSVLSEASKCGVPASVVKVLADKLRSKDAKKSKRATRAVATDS